jgi:hypothetical protein
MTVADAPSLNEILNQWLLEHADAAVAPAVRRLIWEDRAYWWPLSYERLELRHSDDDTVLMSVDLGNSDFAITDLFWKEAT